MVALRFVDYIGKSSKLNSFKIYTDSGGINTTITLFSHPKELAPYKLQKTVLLVVIIPFPTAFQLAPVLSLSGDGDDLVEAFYRVARCSIATLEYQHHQV